MVTHKWAGGVPPGCLPARRQHASLPCHLPLPPRTAWGVVEWPSLQSPWVSCWGQICGVSPVRTAFCAGNGTWLSTGWVQKLFCDFLVSAHQLHRIPILNQRCPAEAPVQSFIYFRRRHALTFLLVAFEPVRETLPHMRVSKVNFSGEGRQGRYNRGSFLIIAVVRTEVSICFASGLTGSTLPTPWYASHLIFLTTMYPRLCTDSKCLV